MTGMYGISREEIETTMVLLEMLVMTRRMMMITMVLL
jgi:hypothetical protein